MAILSEKDAAEVKTFFDKSMVNPITLRLFVQDPEQPGECMYCADTEQIVREISELNPKIELLVHKSPTEGDLINQYQIERVPALIVEEKESNMSGVRFYGIPSGYEFGTLIEDIADISSGQTKLMPGLIKQVEKIQEDVTIKVFVTPT